MPTTKTTKSTDDLAASADIHDAGANTRKRTPHRAKDSNNKRRLTMNDHSETFTPDGADDAIAPTGGSNQLRNDGTPDIPSVPEAGEFDGLTVTLEYTVTSILDCSEDVARLTLSATRNCKTVCVFTEELDLVKTPKQIIKMMGEEMTEYYHRVMVGLAH